MGTWKTSEAENEKRRQMALAAEKAAAQKEKAAEAELARKNAANARQNMQSQVGVIFRWETGIRLSGWVTQWAAANQVLITLSI